MEGSKVFRNLYRLNLCGNRKINDQAAKTLAGSETFKNLTHLNLGGTSITEKGVEALLNSQNLNEIRWLNIGGTEVAPATLKQLKSVFRKRSFKTHTARGPVHDSTGVDEQSLEIIDH